MNELKRPYESALLPQFHFPNSSAKEMPILTFKSLSHPPIPSLPTPTSLLPTQLFLSPKPSTTLSRFRLLAQNNNFNQETKNPQDQIPKQQQEFPSGNGGGGGDGNNGGDDLKRNGKPLFNIKWSDLLFDPDPDNLLAVGLTGLLTWASLQVLWQLFFISLAILVAALKYSFIAALLIFILITLL